jgi:hypothetical protein
VVDGARSSVRWAGRGAWRSFAAAILLIFTLAGSGVAHASPRATCPPDDPYCKLEPSPPTPPPDCTASSSTAARGDHLFATISNVPVGSQVALTFDGVKVGEATATSDGAARPALGGAVVHWTVPVEAEAGPHALVFSGVGVFCNPADGGLEILGETTTRVGGGSLARTGTQVALYLAFALVLVVVGAQLLRVARRRRRRAIRRRNEVGHLDRIPMPR